MKITIFLILLLAPIQALSATASEYRAMSQIQKSAWIIGVVDGLSTEELIQTGSQPKMSQCLSKYTWSQIQAIFDKHLDVNPEAWHHPVAFSFRFKFHELCGTAES